jgi:Na+/proline symporter
MIPIVFCIFMAAIFYLAFKGYQHVHSAEDFIVAGWDLPLPMVTWSLVAALMAAPFYFAAVGSGYFTGGFEASATMGGLASCMILGAFIWVKPIRRLKAWTIGDYYGLRFADKKLGAFAGSIMIVAFGMFNGGALAVGGGYIIQTIFNIPFWAGLLIFCILTLIYTNLGGLWSMAYADILNGIVSVIGIVVISAVIYFSQRESIFHPDWWDMGKLFSKGGADFWTLYLVLAIGDIPAADLGQRACGAKNPKVAQWSMVLAGIVIMTIAWTPGMLGEAFKTIFPGVENAEPLTLEYAKTYWHPIFAALFLTAMAGMAMSTLAACFVSCAGISSKNLYLDFMKKKPSTSQLLLITRAGVLLFTIISIVLALAFGKVLELAYLAWDIIFVTITWPLVIPPFWKGASKKGVWASIIVGLVVYTLTSIWGVPGGDDGGLIWLIFQVPVFFSTTISLIVFIIGSLVFPPGEAELRAHEIETDASLDEVHSAEDLDKTKNAAA